MLRKLMAGTILVGGLAAFVLPGCGGGSVAACDAACDCSACTEAEWASCVQQGGDTDEEIAHTNCGGPYDDFLGCISDKATCKSHHFDTGPCEGEARKLNDCLSKRHQ